MQDQYNAENFKIILPAVLDYMKKTADEQLPKTGKFPKFGIRLSCPDDKYTGILTVEPRSDGVKRVATASVYREGTDRLVSNYFFFENSQAFLTWLDAEKTVVELMETYMHLREKAFQED